MAEGRSQEWLPRSFARALRLGERLPCPAGAPGEGARRRLARWRSCPPFEDDRWWQARLLADGLSEREMLALLGEEESCLAGRLVVPEWAGWFAEVMLGRRVLAERRPGEEGAADLAFASLVEPLVSAGRVQLAVRLRALAAGEGEIRFDPEHLAGQLCEPLRAGLHRMLVRTLVRELHNARRAGELRGDDGEQRFASFVAGLQRSAWRRRELFARYPVLAQQLAAEVEGWLAASERFAAHLAADAAMVERKLAGGNALGAVVRVQPGLGDRHRGGATVTLVDWADGTQTVYKPRPMQVDAHFWRLLGWVNDRGLSPALRVMGCLDRGDHGWMEYVAAAPCPDGAARRRFYRRQGALLALVYLLGGNDFHAENLIAAGEDPVLVDLETLIQPGLPQAAGLSPADEAAEQAVTSSVMAAGLLPRQAWITPAGAGVDVSGLGWRPGQQSPLAVPVIRDAGLDTMRIELDHVVMATPGCGPADTVLDYVPDILDGFTQTYQLCSRHTGELAGLLAAFDGDQVRVLLRPTLWYGAVLGASFHPDLLGDALDRERHFDALWRDVPDRPGLAACIPAERADLWRNDIPVFTAVTSEPILRDADGQPVAGLTLVSGMDRLRIRLNSLGEADLAQQRWLIAGALATSAIEITETAPQPAGLQLAAGPPLVPAAHDRFGQDLLLQTADAIGRHLARIAFVAEGSAQWLGLHSAHGQTWMLDPLPPDLFDGLTGVALFLGWLGRMTADDEHTALARAALATAGQQLDRGALAGAGGMAGLGGLAYALAELGKLWSDDHLIDAAEQRALAITSQAGQDVMFDVAGGSAGTIAGLAALHSIRPSAPLRDAIRACADRLLATAIRTSTGIGWLSDQIRHSRGAQLPIAGYAHGVAGAIAPLFQAAQILQDQRYDDAARAALSYGQALFNSCTGTWTDLCSTAKARAPVTAGQQSLSWCYGSTGIGLSRLQILPYTGPAPLIAQEIDAALAALAALTSQPAGSHCLCHGALGHIDLLLQAATVLSRPALHQAARQHATHMATVISQHGCICGTPLNIETPGLMTGLAGIGYGLLRTINPQLLPAVLTLSPATTS